MVDSVFMLLVFEKRRTLVNADIDHLNGTTHMSRWVGMLYARVVQQYAFTSNISSTLYRIFFSKWLPSCVKQYVLYQTTLHNKTNVLPS